MVEALYDDLNTAQAMAALHGLRNAAASGGERERGEFAASLRLVGLLSMSAQDWKGRKQQDSGIDPKQIDALISNRTAARARKDFKESDRIRDELAAMGVVIKDGKDADGTGDHLGDRVMTKPDTPFPKHWRYYIFIKWAVIAAAVAARPETLIEVF